MTDLKIYLPPKARNGLRLWLSGRKRIDSIDHLRYVQLITEQALYITFSEFMALIDFTGYGLLDALIGRMQ